MKTTKEVTELALLAMKVRAEETSHHPAGTVGYAMFEDYKEAIAALETSMTLVLKYASS